MIVYITTHLPQYTCISTNMLYGRGGVINRKGRGIILISAQNIDKTLDSSETTCVSTMKRCYLCHNRQTIVFSCSEITCRWTCQIRKMIWLIIILPDVGKINCLKQLATVKQWLEGKFPLTVRDICLKIRHTLLTK